MHVAGCGFILASLLLFVCCGHPSPSTVIVLCAGDSLTEMGYPAFLRTILRENGVKARVLNYGRSGNTSGEYLRFLLQKRDVLAGERPDFILLQLGTNDVREDGDRTTAQDFYTNMNRIAEILRGFKTRYGNEPLLLLATIPPVPENVPFPFSRESGRRVRAEVNPLLEKISAEKNFPLVDNHSFFVVSPNLLADVHPTEAGYRLMAQNWFKALRPHLR